MRIPVFSASISSSLRPSFLLSLMLLTWIPILIPMLTLGRAHAQTSDAKHLLIYSIDVEGGQSTLLVSPSGASLLVDAGWPDHDGRNAGRIQAAMKDAGITRIDHLLITHFHTDHVGGVPELVKRVPIGEFLDHGQNREDSDITRHDYAAYLKAIQGKPRRIVHPGDTIDISGAHSSSFGAIVLTAD